MVVVAGTAAYMLGLVPLIPKIFLKDYNTHAKMGIWMVLFFLITT